MVNTLNGEAFGYLGFDLRRVRKLDKGKTGYFILMTPKKKTRQAIKTEIREVIQRGGAMPAKQIIGKINAKVAG